MHLIQLALTAGVILVSHRTLASDLITCRDDPARYKARSGELQKIVATDQADRKDQDRFFSDPVFRKKVLKRDLKRRMRVGEIFGEGCFKEARDFAAASLVYQHGDVPEHHFQTFIWARRAIELGDESQKSLSGLGIDRYLVNTGRMQLFASQATKVNGSKCWCLEQVEPSFTDERRIANGNRTMAQSLEWIKELNRNEPSCLVPEQCTEKPLKSTPVGSIPGLW